MEGKLCLLNLLGTFDFPPIRRILDLSWDVSPEKNKTWFVPSGILFPVRNTGGDVCTIPNATLPPDWHGQKPVPRWTLGLQGRSISPQGWIFTETNPCITNSLGQPGTDLSICQNHSPEMASVSHQPPLTFHSTFFNSKPKITTTSKGNEYKERFSLLRL